MQTHGKNLQDRVYTASLGSGGAGISVSTAIDIFTLTPSSSNFVEILSCFVGQRTLIGEEQATLLPIQIVRYAAAGSGGLALLPERHDLGDFPAANNVRHGDTTLGTSPTVLMQEAWNLQVGWTRRWTPLERLIVPSSSILSVVLPVAPPAAITLIARLTFAITV